MRSLTVCHSSHQRQVSKGQHLSCSKIILLQDLHIVLFPLRISLNQATIDKPQAYKIMALSLEGLIWFSSIYRTSLEMPMKATMKECPKITKTTTMIIYFQSPLIRLTVKRCTFQRTTWSYASSSTALSWWYWEQLLS